jgi:deazaflavin-dependent oxidoreductase (nitroreductase family)
MPMPTTDRLARLADHSTLRLTHRGRKTGKAYQVTIWFVVDGAAVYLATMNRQRQWVRNVTQTPRVELQIGSERFAGVVRPLTAESEMRHVYDLLTGKYWAMWLLDWASALVGRNPRRGKLDSGRGGFFHVQIAA